MLLNEEHIMLKAGIEMRFQAQVDDDGVVVAVDMRIDSVKSLEDLKDQWAEGAWEADADARGEHGFIVDIGLHPGH
jgi:hypothetical protein